MPVAGPTAVIQFHIWEVGDVGMTQLQDKLMSSLRHALCDVAMEYYLLTAPLCTIPRHLALTHAPSVPPHHQPPLSAPCTPFHSMQGNCCLNVHACSS